MTVFNFTSAQHRAAAASSGLMHPPGMARRYRVSALALGLLASFAALADAAPSTLPSVQVQEQRRVTADYAGGQVAAGSRVGLLGDKDFMDTPFSTVSYTESFIRDRQAKDLTDVIAATDPTVFSNGVTGAWSENYAIRGFASNTSDTTFNGLSGMAPYYRTSPEMFERIEVLKARPRCSTACRRAARWWQRQPGAQARRRATAAAGQCQLRLRCAVRHPRGYGPSPRRRQAVRHPLQRRLP
jgi:iron complex outermembrane receptor protein